MPGDLVLFLFRKARVGWKLFRQGWHKDAWVHHHQSASEHSEVTDTSLDDPVEWLSLDSEVHLSGFRVKLLEDCLVAFHIVDEGDCYLLTLLESGGKKRVEHLVIRLLAYVVYC